MHTSTPIVDTTPGSIVWLPSEKEIPKSSILFTQRAHHDARIRFGRFQHAVVILDSFNDNSFVSFLTILPHEIEILRRCEHNKIWPLALINNSRKTKQSKLVDYAYERQGFPQLYFNSYCSKLYGKFWIDLRYRWSIEAQHLQPLPLSPSDKNWISTEWSISNNMKFLRAWIEDYTTHTFSRTVGYRFRSPITREPKIGHVYYLNHCLYGSLIQNHALTYRESVIITWSAPDGQLYGYVLIAFSVKENYDQAYRYLENGTGHDRSETLGTGPKWNPPCRRWLPIEGYDAPLPYDDVPTLRLGKGSAQFRHWVFVDAKLRIKVSRDVLLCDTKGHDEHFIDPESVQMVEDHHLRLQNRELEKFNPAVQEVSGPNTDAVSTMKESVGKTAQWDFVRPTFSPPLITRLEDLPQYPRLEETPPEILSDPETQQQWNKDYRQGPNESRTYHHIPDWENIKHKYTAILKSSNDGTWNYDKVQMHRQQMQQSLLLIHQKQQYDLIREASE